MSGDQDQQKDQHNSRGGAGAASESHDSEVVRDQSPPSDPAAPAAAPAPPSVNPFASRDSESRFNGPDLPPAFDPVLHQLPPAVRAKLKTVDVSTAQVVIQTPTGKRTDPTPLLWFVEDFGQEAAALVGRAGLLRVSVLEPGKDPWYFGLKVEAAEGDAPERGGDWREAFDRVIEQQQRFMESVKMELLLASGRAPAQQQQTDNFERELERLTRLMEVMRASNPQTDPGALIRTTFESMGSALDGFSAFRDKAGSVASERTPDPIDQFNRLTENPHVGKGLEMVFSKVLGARSTEVVAGKAAPPSVNPFADKGAA